MLDYLPSGIVYLGLDLSEEYIAEAQQRRGDRGTFHAGRAEEAEWLASQQFDLVSAIGVLHHLGDAEAEAMMAISRSALNAGGRMVTVDPCFHEQQSSLARFLIGKDRGQNVRTEQGYRNLARPYFSTSKSTVRHDLLRIPYTHCILECTGRIVGLTGGGQGNPGVRDVSQVSRTCHSMFRVARAIGWRIRLDAIHRVVVKLALQLPVRLNPVQGFEAWPPDMLVRGKQDQILSALAG